MAPVIGISVSLEAPDQERTLFRNKVLQYLEDGMVEAVRASGGLPVLLPLLRDESASRDLIEICDGLLLSGGSDVAPTSYGETALDPAWKGDHERDLYELALVHAAELQGKPVLGICRGCQLLAVAHGGRLWQDIETQVDGAMRHRDQELYDGLAHEVEIEKDSRLAKVLDVSLRGARQTVNSVHHQAIRDVAGELRVVARASDGTIEAVESMREDRFILGVQWHPEWMERQPSAEIDAFIDECERLRQHDATA